MAGGWSRDGAVQDQIDASVKDAIEQARGKLPAGDSLSHCEQCDAAIPEARRKAVVGVWLCIQCQSAEDESQAHAAMFNRRGSKDSQLR